MILRILRARVRDGAGTTLAEYIRDEAIVDVLRTPGLVSFQPAIREGEGGPELVIVSTWRSMDDLLARGQPLDAVLTIPKVAGLVVDSRAEHFEVVHGEARAMPLQRAVLRIAEFPIRPQAEAAYFAEARRQAVSHLDDAGMVAITIARRSAGARSHAVVVTLWEEGAIEVLLGSSREGLIAQDAIERYIAGPAVVEHFDALMATDPRPDAQAILVADDEGRYLYATPAAARLTGYPLARLLTMRIADVAVASVRPIVPELWERFIEAGVSVGEFDLARPGSSVTTVRFAAKSNTPWPGSHSSVLTLEERPVEDVDRALADAGLIARYLPAEVGSGA